MSIAVAAATDSIVISNNLPAGAIQTAEFTHDFDIHFLIV